MFRKVSLEFLIRKAFLSTLYTVKPDNAGRLKNRAFSGVRFSNFRPISDMWTYASMNKHVRYIFGHYQKISLWNYFVSNKFINVYAPLYFQGLANSKMLKRNKTVELQMWFSRRWHLILFQVINWEVKEELNVGKNGYRAK